ncbi:rod-binding protein [Muricoccus radiodurans]|uniref:rod-binding protein n=1 Tax=Muricoccus radiodurans TaxID=2231721 RepID=UPI003CEF9EF6
MTAITPPAGGANTSPAALRRVAQRFEAQALGALLQPVFGEAPKGFLSGGSAEAQWRPMLVEQYAKSWSQRGGVGIANAVHAEMLRMQGRSAGEPPLTPPSTNPAPEGTAP